MIPGNTCYGMTWKVSRAAASPISSGPFPQKPRACTNLNNLATAVCKTQPYKVFIIQIQKDTQIQKDFTTAESE